MSNTNIEESDAIYTKESFEQKFPDLLVTDHQNLISIWVRILNKSTPEELEELEYALDFIQDKNRCNRY